MSSFEENIKDNTSSSSVATGTTDLEESIDNLVLHGSKNVSEIMAIDAEDESLRKYKETLLGSAAHGDLGEIEVLIIMLMMMMIMMMMMVLITIMFLVMMMIMITIMIVL